MFGGDSGGVPHVPIPNTTVKPSSADGTWTAGSWESRTLPSKVKRHTPYWDVSFFWNQAHLRNVISFTYFLYEIYNRISLCYYSCAYLTIYFYFSSKYRSVKQQLHACFIRKTTKGSTFLGRFSIFAISLCYQPFSEAHSQRYEDRLERSQQWCLA